MLEFIKDITKGEIKIDEKNGQCYHRDNENQKWKNLFISGVKITVKDYKDGVEKIFHELKNKGMVELSYTPTEDSKDSEKVAITLKQINNIYICKLNNYVCDNILHLEFEIGKEKVSKKQDDVLLEWVEYVIYNSIEDWEDPYIITSPCLNGKMDYEALSGLYEKYKELEKIDTEEQAIETLKRLGYSVNIKGDSVSIEK